LLGHLSVRESFGTGDIVRFALVTGFRESPFGEGGDIANIDDTDLGVSGGCK